MPLPQLNRILYVEDEPDIRNIATIALESVGRFTVCACESGAEALAALSEFKPDLILLDVMMPGMDGPTTLVKLRERPEATGIPVAFMTAKAQSAEVAALKCAGAIDVIPKPFDPMTLSETVRALWGQHANPRQSTVGRGPDRESADGTFERKVESIRRDFLTRLPHRVGEIEQAVSELAVAGDPGAALLTVRRLVHTLRGSAGTLGMLRIAESAARFESLIVGLLEGRAAIDSATQASLRQCLALLQESSTDPLLSRAAPSASAAGSFDGRHLALAASHGLRARSDAPHRTAARRLFLLESTADSLQPLAEHLVGFGFAAQLFADIQALQAAAVENPPVAIVARLDGEARAAAVMADGATSADSIPLVFVSREDDFGARLEAVRCGAQAFFVEPVRLGEFADMLEKLDRQHLPEPYKVVVVEDSETQAGFIAAILEAADMQAIVVSDPRAVIRTLEQVGADLILMDMNLPGCSGDEVARVIRQMDAHMSVPIVFLSIEQDFARQLVAMGRGGDEFLTKPILPSHLVSVVASRIERYRQLRTLMLQDSLTGLLNHSRLQQQIDLEAAKALRHGIPLTLVMIDVDHFKQVNDVHGHPVGDRVLKNLARFLAQRLRRTSDVIGRYGGEEFAVVLSNTDADSAHRVIDALRHDFSNLVHQSDYGPFRVTFSAGLCDLSERTTGRELVLAADRALYRAKKNGRNRIEIERLGPSTSVGAHSHDSQAGTGT